MFCYLFMFFDGTSIPIYEKEKCFKKCRYFKDGDCSLGCKTKEKLSKSVKYGWISETAIFLDDSFFSRSGNTKYNAAISLNHPASSVVWIIKCERLDKNTEPQKWRTIYRFHRGHEGTEFDDLDSLNRWMRKNLSYDGRNIVEDDFVKKENDV